MLVADKLRELPPTNDPRWREAVARILRDEALRITHRQQILPREEREEVAHDAVLTTIDRLEQGGSVDKIDRYLRKVVKCRSLDRLRARSAARRGGGWHACELEQLDAHAFEHPRDGVLAIEQLLARLSDEERTLIRLKAEGRTSEEMAVEMGFSSAAMARKRYRQVVTRFSALLEAGEK